MVRKSENTQAERIVADYCRGVLDGSVPACELVKAAVQRHLTDMAASADGGWLFRMDWAAVQHVVDFFKLLKHWKGKWAGQEFVLEPWQVFIVASLFGWKRRSTGYRRYGTAYIEVPRKNGKSAFLAGLQIYCLVADGEPGAEVYTAATKLDQAKIIHEHATEMVKASPELRKHVRIFRNNLSVDATSSKCMPLGRDHDTQDGFNPSFVAIDELHAHKDSGVWDVMDTADGSRDESMQVAITTAGFIQTAICFDLHTLSISLLAGQKTDDSFFCFIASVDASDLEAWADKANDLQAWTDEPAWIKANPNWDVSVLPQKFRDKAVKAGNVPSLRPAFLTKRLNIWCASAISWMDLAIWDLCGGDPIKAEALRGRRCWGGLDLASRTDLAAFWLAFERPDDEGLDLLGWAWVPRDNAIARSKSDGVPYMIWADDPDSGCFLTNGNVIDYLAITQVILDAGRDFDLQFICADRWGLEFLRQHLEGCGAEIVEFGQGFQSMNPAIRETERMIHGKLLHHGGNPVLRWAVQNVVSVTDPRDNIAFSKKASTEKIDPAIAMVMAVAGAMVGRTQQPQGTFYETHELEMA